MRRYESFVARMLVGCGVIVAAAASVRAQDPLHRGRFIAGDSSAVEAERFEEYASQCPANVPDACAVYTYPATSRDCRVAGIDSLFARGGSMDRIVRYLSSATYRESDTESWTCRADIAVLLHVSPDGRAIPIWMDSTERTFEFIRDATTATHGEADLLSILYCLNGTGGCFDNLLIRRGDDWSFLGRDSTWDRVYAQLPGGYRTHKSPPIELDSLRWEQYIAGPHDANCCPSGRLLLDLGVVGDELTVKRARLEADLNLDR